MVSVEVRREVVEVVVAQRPEAAEPCLKALDKPLHVRQGRASGRACLDEVAGDEQQVRRVERLMRSSKIGRTPAASNGACEGRRRAAIRRPSSSGGRSRTCSVRRRQAKAPGPRNWIHGSAERAACDRAGVSDGAKRRAAAARVRRAPAVARRASSGGRRSRDGPSRASQQYGLSTARATAAARIPLSGRVRVPQSRKTPRPVLSTVRGALVCGTPTCGTPDRRGAQTEPLSVPARRWPIYNALVRPPPSGWSVARDPADRSLNRVPPMRRPRPNNRGHRPLRQRRLAAGDSRRGDRRGGAGDSRRTRRGLRSAAGSAADRRRRRDLPDAGPVRAQRSWGCLVMDVDAQTLCATDISPATKSFGWCGPRSIRNDRKLQNFNTDSRAAGRGAELSSSRQSGRRTIPTPARKRRPNRRGAAKDEERLP